MSLLSEASGSRLCAVACLMAILITVGPAAAQDVADHSKLFLQRDLIAELNSSTIAKSLCLSPDGNRVAGIFRRGEKQVVFVNNEELGEFTGIVKDSMSFSPDSKRFAFGAMRDGKYSVFIDGKEYDAFDGNAEGTPIFSPDSRRHAFFSRQNGKVVVTIDGETSQSWDNVVKQSLTFSLDSKRIAYIAKDGDYGRVIVDGAAGSKYRNIAAFSFSPDGLHYAYVAMSLTQSFVVVNGREAFSADNFIRDSLRFHSESRLHILSLAGRKITRVQIDLIPSVETKQHSGP